MKTLKNIIDPLQDSKNALKIVLHNVLRTFAFVYCKYISHMGHLYITNDYTLLVMVIVCVPIYKDVKCF